MPVKVDPEKCSGCKTCEDVCPVQSIHVPSAIAEVKPDDCIECNACVDSCVDHALTMAD